MKTLSIHDKINIRADRMKKGIGCTPESQALDRVKYGEYVYAGQCLYNIKSAK